MQFILVLKFSKLCRTKDIFTCLVPLVIWFNWQCCSLLPNSLMLEGRSIHKILWQKILPGDVSSFMFEPLVPLWMFAFLLLIRIHSLLLLLLLFSWVFFLNTILFVLFTKTAQFSKNVSLYKGFWPALMKPHHRREGSIHEYIMWENIFFPLRSWPF